MKVDRKWTIAIRPSADQPLRKVTKIIGLNGGGFSVLAPYHKSKSGFLCKMPVDPSKKGIYKISWDKVTAYTADERVKLSYHTDWFVQFSGESSSGITSGGITSGIDPSTGEPNGLGLFPNPLTSPIWSGSSIGITVLGMDDFDEAQFSDNLIMFEPNEFYYRGCLCDEANAWIVSIWVFPVHVVPPVRFFKGQAVLDVAAEPLNGNLLSVMQFKLANLRNEKVFSCHIPSRSISISPLRQRVEIQA
jgi:hypothetical protein